MMPILTSSQFFGHLLIIRHLCDGMPKPSICPLDSVNGHIHGRAADFYVRALSNPPLRGFSRCFPSGMKSLQVRANRFMSRHTVMRHEKGSSDGFVTSNGIPLVSLLLCFCGERCSQRSMA